MIQGIELSLRCSTGFWIGKIPVRVTALEDVALSFSGSQGFLVLVAGIVLAIAFQLLITNFFIALGISYSDSEDESDFHVGDSMDDRITRVGTVVGLRTLGTISLSLFAACFLSIKLCLTGDSTLGAILGIVIWAAYFSLLLGVSLTSAGSLIGTVVNAATSGLQGIVGTAAIAIGAKNVTEQVVSTADAAATAIRRELSSAVDSATAHQAIDSYLQKLQLSEVEYQKLQDKFQRLVADPEMKFLARENHRRNVRRQTFVDLVANRTDFSKQNVTQAVDQWEIFWQQLWGQQQQKSQKSTDNGLARALMSAHPSEPQPGQLTAKLERLIEETRERQAQQQQEAKQKVAETAAWWLLGTAFFSAAASAIAGVLSVRG